MQPRILIAGIGNIFFGDDAFGVEVVRRLRNRPLPPDVKVVDFGIRGLDLAYALLEPFEAAILVDAMPRGGEPGSLYLVEPRLDAADPPPAMDGHVLDPVKVLRLAQSLGDLPADLVIVGCEPGLLPDENDDLLAEFSEPVRRAFEPAISMIEEQVVRLRDRIGALESAFVPEGMGAP